MLHCRHLYYSWVVTKEGGFASAAERQDMAAHTISAQVRQLEQALGHPLLKPSGGGEEPRQTHRRLLPTWSAAASAR